MSLQLQDILANPVLLKDVSEETLQSWIKQYPYVSIFHLFSLKNKNHYSETDLHKTAFYFNNREKLYFLLNDKHSEISKNTSKDKTGIDLQAENTPKEKSEIEIPEEIIEHPIITEQIENQVVNNEVENKQTESILFEKHSPTPLENDKTKEVTIEEVLKSPFEEETVSVITETNTEDKPLTVAEKILLEIQQLKEERANKENKTSVEEESAVQLKNIEAPISETNNDKADFPDKSIIEEQQIVTEEIITEKEKENTSTFENSAENNLIEESESSIEKNTLEKPLSIQEEVIARINKIKEERLQKNTENQETAKLINDNSEIPIQDNNEIIENKSENRIDDEKHEISELKSEKPLSIQEEIIARINKIKEERAQKLTQEETDSKLTLAVNTDALKNTDTNENQETNIDTITPTVEKTAEKEEEVLVKESIEQTIKISDDTITEDVNQFNTPFPEPVLVSVDITHLKEEKLVVTEEQLKEEIIVPIKDILENKATASESIKAIIEDLHVENQEKQAEVEIAETAALISKKSDLFIPNIEEDSIEERNEEKITEENIQDSTRNIQHLKEEPHTFVEWLKLLDGNLQIQTAETAKETENWIEIPRYEVEQTITHKKEIQKEEQKLFEPNFEEGEIDLFNEIDEEVTKVASESVSFKEDMMTETLAKIYHKQGKTDKALEIYNTLLLKFPKKSSYFAGLIKKIEKEK